MVISKSPSKTDITSEPTPITQEVTDYTLSSQNDPNNLETDDEEAQPIVYPSHKLGALTTLRKKMMKHLKVKNQGNFDYIHESFPKFQEKLKKFYDACSDQVARTDVSSEQKDALEEWFKTNYEVNEGFESKVMNWLNIPGTNELSEDPTKDQSETQAQKPQQQPQSTETNSQVVQPSEVVKSDCDTIAPLGAIGDLAGANTSSADSLLQE